jgi:hypothetical protein
MATYLQGQQDYTSQIQPTSPNLQFDAQLLGNMQAKYDAGHKKVSELYGSLLNSAMTRTDNQEARNEFFQMINNDIRRMGSLDFSLQQNVDASANVFQSIYTNKGIVKDMVWTKNFSQQMQKRESLKNSTNTEKTGSAWDVGDRAMAYKREAFANATADEALGMGNAEYVPQQNMMKDAIKLATEAKLNVTIDKTNGKYKITTKNGELIKSPLTTLFAETFAKDPKYKAMYDTKAYVSREDWQHNAVNKGEFTDLDQAKVGFLQDFKARQSAQLKKSASALDIDLSFIGSRVKDELKELKAGKFLPDSDRGRRLQELQRLEKGAASAKAYTDQLILAEKSTNPDAAYDVLVRTTDNQQAYSYMNEDITGAVRTLAFRDAEQTLTADEYGKLNAQHLNKMSEMKQKNTYEVALQGQKDIAALERAKIKGVGGSLTGQSTINTARKNIAKIMSDQNLKYSSKGIDSTAKSDTGRWKNLNVTDLPVTNDQLDAWRESNTDAGNAKVALYDQLIKEGYNAKEDSQRDANNYFIKANKSGSVSSSAIAIPFANEFNVEMLEYSSDQLLKDKISIEAHLAKHVQNTWDEDDGTQPTWSEIQTAFEEMYNNKTIAGTTKVIDYITKKLKK